MSTCPNCKHKCHKVTTKYYYRDEDQKKGKKDYYHPNRIRESTNIMAIDYSDYTTLKQQKTRTITDIVGYNETKVVSRVFTDAQGDIRSDSGTLKTPKYEWRSEFIPGEYEIYYYYAVWLDVDDRFRQKCGVCVCEKCQEESIRRNERLDREIERLLKKKREHDECCVCVIF